MGRAVTKNGGGSGERQPMPHLEAVPTPAPDDNDAPPAEVVAASRLIRATIPPDAPDADEQLERAFEALGDYVLKKSGGGGDGDGPGPGDVIKKVRGNTWLIGLLVLLFGSGGIVTNYYLTQQQAEDNASAIEEHGELPMHGEAAKRVDKIERDVADTQQAVQRVEAQQFEIAAGIESLKQESIKARERRLREELDDMKRKLREERRNNR